MTKINFGVLFWSNMIKMFWYLIKDERESSLLILETAVSDQIYFILTLYFDFCMMRGWYIVHVCCVFTGRCGPCDGKTVREWFQPDHNLSLRGSQPQLQKHVQAQTSAGEMAERRRYTTVTDISILLLQYHWLFWLENKQSKCKIQQNCCFKKNFKQKNNNSAAQNMQLWLTIFIYFSLETSPPDSMNNPTSLPPLMEGYGRKRKKRTSIETNIKMTLEKRFMDVSSRLNQY